MILFCCLDDLHYVQISEIENEAQTAYCCWQIQTNLCSPWQWHKMSTIDYLDGAYAEISATLPSTVKVAVLSRNHVKANKNIFPSMWVSYKNTITMQFQKFSYKTGDKYISKDFPILTLLLESEYAGYQLSVIYNTNQGKHLFIYIFSIMLNEVKKRIL